MNYVLEILNSAEQALIASNTKDTQQLSTEKEALDQIKEAKQLLSTTTAPNNITKLNPAQEPDEVLQRAIGNYQNVLILGWDKEGDLDARADLGTTKETCLYLTQQFTHNLMNGNYTE